MSKYQTGNKNGQWKGGRTTTQHGYILIRVGVNYPGADVRGYIYEHRLVAEKKIGRPLLRGEIVHHIDGNKLNNDPNNIEVVNGIFHHLFLHRKNKSNKRIPGEPNSLIPCKCRCGRYFMKYDQSNRPRQYINGHNGKKEICHE